MTKYLCTGHTVYVWSNTFGTSLGLHLVSLVNKMSWFSVSNAFDRSRKIENGNFFPSIYSFILSTNLRAASSVEWFLRNPYWLLKRRWLDVKYSEICLNATFSNIWSMEDNEDIGRQFPKTLWSSFLYNGLSLASLSLLENMPEHKDWLIIMLSWREMIHFMSFNNFEDKLS